MTRPQYRSILMVEDSPSLAHVYCEYLTFEPFDIHVAETGAAALTYLEQNVPDLILLDLHLPDMSGMEILKHIDANASNVPVIMITAHGSVDTAVEAMALGARDFLEKPFDRDRLVVTLANVLETDRLTRLLDTLSENQREHFEGFIGRSPAMQAIYTTVESAAPSRASIFITGESGTGKEVCAEAIHKRSPRADHEFVAINCAAIPKDLIESEIFGHVKGAFTGAISDRDGAATRANGGTLFLDEIAEMDLELQAKLLRFVQTGTFQKVGSSKSEKVDVRFVAATNRDPLEEVEGQRFREDLYYRLHVIPIQLPPLRERGDDVVLIAEKFLAEFSAEERKSFKKFSDAALEFIKSYRWPGNVRELQNILRNIIVLNDGPVVEQEMFPLVAEKSTGAASLVNERSQVPKTITAAGPESIKPLWQTEQEAIEHAIDVCEGNVSRAAAFLEVSPSTLYRKMKTWADSGA